MVIIEKQDIHNESHIELTKPLWCHTIDEVDKVDLSEVLRFFRPPPSIITIDDNDDDEDEDDETLELKNKKTDDNNLDSPTCKPLSYIDAIILEDDETLGLKNKKTDDDNLDSLIFKSLGSLSSIDDIILEDDETLEPKKKKQRLGSWWDDVEVFNELSSVFKGSSNSTTKDNVVGSKVDSSSFSSACPHERSLSSSRHDDDDDNFIDLSMEPTQPSTSSNNKGNSGGHVTLEELGLSVEDLKRMPWEAFDPTWEIRSLTMDPWLGGYIQDMF